LSKSVKRSLPCWGMPCGYGDSPEYDAAGDCLDDGPVDGWIFVTVARPKIFSWFFLKNVLLQL